MKIRTLTPWAPVTRWALTLALVGLTATVGAVAQTAPEAPTTPQSAEPPQAPEPAPAPRPRRAPEPPEPPQAPEAPDLPSLGPEISSTSREAVRIGSDYTLPAGSTAREVVVVFGSATIEGRVEGDLVVVLGALHLASSAVVDGDIAVIGGTTTVDAGAVANRDLVVVAGAIESPPGFVAGGEQTIIGPLIFGDGLRALVPWVTRGVFWGRLLVPDLPWLWGFVGIVFLVYLALNLILDRPVRACAEKLAERPLSTFLVGLLVLLLTGPVSVVLAVSVVGLVVLPFLICALFIAGLLGKVGVLRAMGNAVVGQGDPDSRAQSARSFTIGFVAVALLYMAPVLGIAAFFTLGVTGLGAATLAFATGLRRENPAPPSAPVAPPPVMPPTPGVSGPFSGGAEGSQLGTAGATMSAAVPPMPMPSDLALFPKAMFGHRLGGFALDLVLVLLTYGLLGLNDHDGPGRFLLLLLIYRIGFWAWKGTTVGGIICQLRVVRTDGAPLRVVDALVRGLSSVFSFAVLGIGYLWILRDADRQSWHDKIAGTFVVKVPKNWPLP